MTSSLFLFKRFDLAIIVAIAFVFSGLMFGPDLDIFSVQYQRWGWLKFIWLPYQKAIKHRSIFSHGMIIGTIIRILYLSFILLLVSIFTVAIAQIIFGFPWHWQKFTLNGYTMIKNRYLLELLALLIGLELGAMSHYLADEIGSWSKIVAFGQKSKPRQSQKVGKNRRKKKK